MKTVYVLVGLRLVDFAELTYARRNGHGKLTARKQHYTYMSISLQYTTELQCYRFMVFCDPKVQMGNTENECKDVG